MNKFILTTKSMNMQQTRRDSVDQEENFIEEKLSGNTGKQEASTVFMSFAVPGNLLEQQNNPKITGFKSQAFIMLIGSAGQETLFTMSETPAGTT